MSREWYDYFNEFVISTFPSAIDSLYDNMSIDIARKYQDIIDWDLLSGNTENNLITFIDIMNNDDLPWNYCVISYHYAKWADCLEYHDWKHWDMVNLAHMKDLTLNDIIINPHIDWDYEVLSYRDFLTKEFIANNMDKNWDMKALSSHKVVDLEFIQSHNMKWDYEGMLYNPNIDIEYFINKQEFNKHLDLLQSRFMYFNKDTNEYDMINIIDNIMKYPLAWDYDIIASLKSFDVDKFFELKIDYTMNETQLKALYDGLSSNKHLDFHKHILPRISSPHWNYRKLSANPIITMEIVKNYDLPWNYMALSLNPSITEEDVLNNPDINWFHWNLSLNPNISWEFVKQHKTKLWNPNGIIKKNILFSEIENNKDLFKNIEIDDICEKYFIAEKYNFINKSFSYKSDHSI